MITATIHEMFSGIQGEGLLVGYRQLFVRFHGCHLDCRYCDTPASRLAAPATCAAEVRPGERELAHLPNPMTVPAVLGALQRLEAGFPHHSVSLTGGEPLLHGAFLDALLPALHEEGLCSYLETNGALPAALAALATMPHYVAMDMKLPSVAGTAPLWAAHGAFLETAASRLAHPRTHLQVKLVFGEDSLDDVAHAAALVAAVDAQVPCILQPVTPRPGGPAAPSPATVLEAQRLAAGQLVHARVIPQTHVMLEQW